VPRRSRAPVIGRPFAPISRAFRRPDALFADLRSAGLRRGRVHAHPRAVADRSARRDYAPACAHHQQRV